MSRWSDGFKSHAFWSTFNSLKSTFQDESFYAGQDAQILSEISRLHKVISYIESYLEQVDTELTPRSSLDGLTSPITNVLQHVAAFKSNPSISYLTTANDFADTAIVFVRQMPMSNNANDKKAIAKSTLSYIKSTEDQLKKVSDFIDVEIADKTDKILGVEKEVSSTKTELSNLKTKLDTVEQTIQKQTAEFNNQFQLSEKSRLDKFTLLETKLETKLDETSTKLQGKADSEFSALAIKSEIVIKVLNSYQEKAAKVYGVVSNTLQAGAYSSYANEEKKSANFFRWSAITLMIIAVGILVIPEIIKIYKNLENYQLDWHLTLGRVPFSLILFVPAFYLARESGKHRNTEIVNRRRELILSTIDPYLALFDSVKAEEIKSNIANGIFSESTQTEDSSVSEAGNVISQIVKVWLGK